MRRHRKQPDTQQSKEVSTKKKDTKDTSAKKASAQVAGAKEAEAGAGETTGVKRAARRKAGSKKNARKKSAAGEAAADTGKSAGSVGKSAGSSGSGHYVVIKSSRYHLLDGIRGLALVSMILFHGAWDAVYILGRNWTWYQGYQSYVWQQSICWTFIILSGFCMTFSKHPIRRGLLVFACGALITAVTMVAVPADRIIFGILTFLGAAMLLTGIFRKLLSKIPSWLGLLLSVVLFVLTRYINDGYIGLWSHEIQSMPNAMYQGWVASFFGFTDPSFWSTDYFSFFPWIFLFLVGFYLSRICKNSGFLDTAFFTLKIPFFSWFGRHSLIVYLLHQPILYAIVLIIQFLGL